MTMKHSRIGAGLVAGTFLCAASAALAQAKPPVKFDFGAMEYKSSCAACHGLTGKGDGSYNAYLTKTPTDLTTLAKRNGGVFPAQRIYEVIDGRTSPEIGAHGTRDMPIWGAQYSDEASSYFYYAFPGREDVEAYARGRILVLVEYINRLQVK
jgi:mono/diheme cytochrome c family protein